MIKNIAYEFRKNFLTRLVIITFVLLTLINLLYIYYDYRSVDYRYNYFLNQSHDKRYVDFISKMHKKLNGEITLENIRFITDEYNRLSKIVNAQKYSTEFQENTHTGYVFGDYTAIEIYFYKPLKYAVMYNNDINDVVQKAEENIYFYERHKNKFEKEKNQFITNNYIGRKIDCFYETKTWERLFDYRFSDFLMICFAVFTTIPIFIQEKETNMNALILSCARGKSTMRYAKIFSLFIFIFFVVVAMSLTNIIFFKKLYGLKGSNLPIYAVQAFKYAPLNCSISSFFIIYSFMKFWGIFSFALVVCLLSLIFKNAIYPYMLSVFYVILGLYLSGFLFSVETNKILASFISPFTLLNGQNLYSSLLSYNIMDKFFLRADLCLFVQLISIILCILIICFWSTKINTSINYGCLKKRVD